MRNRAKETASRWRHLTHKFIVENPETGVAEVYRYSASKRFINHSTIIELRNMPGTHCYVSQCINGNGHVINDHVQAMDSYVSFIITTQASSNKNSTNFFLPNTLAVRLFGSFFTFSFYKLQLSYSHHLCQSIEM